MVDTILSRFFSLKSERLDKLFLVIMSLADDGKIGDITAVTLTAMIVLSFLTYYLWALISLFVGCTYILVISLFKWYFTLRESYREKHEKG
ncbi:hypothetical protein ACQRD4_03980 [Streptococcus hyointestinalis]|uniref:hypothetical protein n=1 Tax=Streptococcus hyointestinalis TaxID=1337 RepID=UPI003CFF3C04